jgi:hypothetical protein
MNVVSAPLSKSLEYFWKSGPMQLQTMHSRLQCRRNPEKAQADNFGVMYSTQNSTDE